jgi:type IV pilus assembly protein PilB
VRKNIGECLLQAGLISDGDLERALAEHRRTGERLGVVLVRLNLVTDKQIARTLAQQLGFSYLSLSDNPPDPRAVNLIPKEVAIKRACIAVGLDANVLTVAMSDPLQFSLVQDLEVQTGCRIRQVVSTRSDILEAIHSVYPTSLAQRPADANPESQSAAGNLQEEFKAAPISEIVDRLVQDAIACQATDLHVEPIEKGVIVRQRLDGILKEMAQLPRSVHEGLIARLKTMAGMDVAEKVLPQDGRLRAISADGTEIDFRAATVRTLYGEKIVLRRLDHRKTLPALDELGFASAALDEVRRFLRHQHGLILVVGPTGSGKSTTLGSAVGSLISPRANIVTIEDPVEYQIPGVNQTQLNDRAALTFAATLQSVLKQDPDVILIGEIREGETARVALQAAQAGRLVLSGIYSDDAISAVTRLIDIGTDPSLVAGGLIGVVAQRLVRRLCLHCRRQHTPTPEVLLALNLTAADAGTTAFYTAVGCDQCHHTGYRGRIGIFEVMSVTDRIRRLISSRAQEDQLRQAAIAGGMVMLGEDGLAKAKAGITTADELIRVVTRVREPRALCPGCGSAVGADFNACPFCGKRLGGSCPHCGRALQPGWNFCPYCARSATDARRPRRLRERDDRGARERPREGPPGNVTRFKKP